MKAITYSDNFCLKHENKEYKQFIFNHQITKMN